MDRRQFLKSAAAASAALAATQSGASFAAAAGDDGFMILRAAASRASLLGNAGDPTPVWAYNDRVPGPTIRAKRGDTVRVRLVNELDQPTTIHWHGIRLENAMDGTMLTQEPVPPGGTFDYVFTVPDAGTFWYHTHNRSWEQLARGLYGPLIVDGDATGFSDDLTLVIDDWRLDRDGLIDEASFGSAMDWSHGGRLGNWVTVNGEDRPGLALGARRPTRLRLINAANARVFALKLPGLDARLIGLDGQVFGAPAALDDPLVLMPAQRADLLVVPQATGDFALTAADGGTDVPLADLLVAQGRGPAEDEPILVENRLAEPDLANPLDLDLLMEGGAMGGMSGAVVGGRHRGSGMSGGGMMGGGMGGGMMGGGRMGLRDLAGAGLAWAFNGVAGMPEEPLFAVRRGTTVRIAMVNDTAWDHGMHVHGHHFRVLQRNGRPEPLTPWRDTASMAPRDRLDVAFVADNPGDWLIHCHMAEHMDAGMMTWFRVT